jgi:hypothetical protein
MIRTTERITRQKWALIPRIEIKQQTRFGMRTGSSVCVNQRRPSPPSCATRMCSPASRAPSHRPRPRTRAGVLLPAVRVLFPSCQEPAPFLARARRAANDAKRTGAINCGPPRVSAPVEESLRHYLCRSAWQRRRSLSGSRIVRPRRPVCFLVGRDGTAHRTKCCDHASLTRRWCETADKPPL